MINRPTRMLLTAVFGLVPLVVPTPTVSAETMATGLGDRCRPVRDVLS
jgi:hypothetical protein